MNIITDIKTAIADATTIGAVYARAAKIVKAAGWTYHLDADSIPDGSVFTGLDDDVWTAPDGTKLVYGLLGIDGMGVYFHTPDGDNHMLATTRGGFRVCR